MLLEEVFGLKLHGFDFSTEGSTDTLLMAGHIKTSTASRTCKCSEFSRAEDTEEIGNNEKWRG